jgi:hypothetical protein
MEDSLLPETSNIERPETEEDWIIKAVNIHGLFFERACRKIIEDTQGWLCRHPLPKVCGSLPLSS